MQDAAVLRSALARALRPELAATIMRCAGIDAARAKPLSMQLHPDDQMLTHSLAEHRHADTALSQYFAIGIQQYRVASSILDAFFKDRDDDLDMLDFACGFGRLLRFVACARPRVRLHASDIQRDALAFCADSLGVATLPSAFDPDDFRANRRFDLIWVASLFSHLPESLFVRWLGALFSHLGEDGVICFSVRGIGLLDGEAGDRESDLVYQPESENADLDPAHYGTTYAGPRFVEAAIRAATGGAGQWWRYPRALANEQDLYVVARRDDAEAPVVRKGPWGWLDLRSRDERGRIRLAGWAADVDASRPARVEIAVDGERRAVMPSIARPDVAAALADPGLGLSGWSFETASAGESIEIVARGEDGSMQLLYAGGAD